MRAQILSKKITVNAFQERGACRCPPSSLHSHRNKEPAVLVTSRGTHPPCAHAHVARLTLGSLWCRHAGKKEGETEQRIRDSTVAPPLEGTPTLPELKLSYYRLMIRYHMARAPSRPPALRLFRATAASFPSHRILHPALPAGSAKTLI